MPSRHCSSNTSTPWSPPCWSSCLAPVISSLSDDLMKNQDALLTILEKLR